MGRFTKVLFPSARVFYLRFQALSVLGVRKVSLQLSSDELM
jgi:hypothetical protein